MNIPLAFGDYKGRSGAVNAMEMVNMMVEPDQQGGAAAYSIVGTPGLKEFVDIGIEDGVRGKYYWDGELYCVVGTSVYRVNVASRAKFSVGTINTDTGPIRWMENANQIGFIDHLYGYVITKSDKSLAQITDADFPVPLSCCCKDSYGIVVEKDTGRLWRSGVNDFTAWDSLSFTTAEYEPDNLVGVIDSPDSLIVFGVETATSYYNSGDSTFPFDPRPGANIKIGCGATHSIAEGDNLVFWLDNRGQVRMLSGFQQEVISTLQVDYRISQLGGFSNAQGFTYSQQGHLFYVLIFPSDDLTLVFDVTTRQWHRRTSADGRWRASCLAQSGSSVFVGDYENGKIYKLDPDTYTDNSDHIRWEFTLQNVNSDQKEITHDLLQIKCESGVGETDNSEPYAWMVYSDDDGRTWSHEKWFSMGKVGEFKKLIRFHALGQSRTRVYKFGGSAPVKRIFTAARLEGTAID